MKKKIVPFFLRLIAFSVILLMLAYILKLLLPENSMTPALPYLFILFLLTTAIVHWILIRITALNPSKFVSYFMLATSVKLIIYFLALLVYIFFFRSGILSFIITFLTLYIFYTVFEVTAILKQTRN